ncbi:MAG: T9SS type A sorting domain-containing protein [Bacteroidia bacterium]|nr:T9SS type A sorting domain-containing protein [Bacteroidia bacterium]
MIGWRYFRIPSRTGFTILFCGEQGGEALLYDSQGRLLARFPVQSGGGSWEVPAGLYFLKREGGSSTIRLWKQ